MSTSSTNELLKPEEAATLLRTSVKAVYTLVERNAIPGVVRVGRRLLFNRAVLRRHLGLTTVPPSPYSDGLDTGAGPERLTP